MVFQLPYQNSYIQVIPGQTEIIFTFLDYKLIMKLVHMIATMNNQIHVHHIGELQHSESAKNDLLGFA